MKYNYLKINILNYIKIVDGFKLQKVEKQELVL